MYHSICVLGIDGIRDGVQVFHDFLYLLLHPGRWVEKPVRGEESSGQKLDSFFLYVILFGTSVCSCKVDSLAAPENWSNPAWSLFCLFTKQVLIRVKKWWVWAWIPGMSGTVNSFVGKPFNYDDFPRESIKERVISFVAIVLGSASTANSGSPARFRAAISTARAFSAWTSLGFTSKSESESARVSSGLLCRVLFQTWHTLIPQKKTNM